MNVVEFPVAIARGGEPGWHDSELQQLASLCSTRYTRGATAIGSWAVDSTEAGDPQFYLLGSGADPECLLCVSRVRRTYVLEDGSGTVLAESRTLPPILNHAKRSLAGRNVTAVVTRLFVALCAIRVTLEEKFEALLPDSVETLERLL